ncbi:hypothetical protein ABE583_02925 [Stenotrophomonas sp. TWI143]|uniref:hypothetical protein n=1 Tax=Stenotrophomonas sp. TWI143 TaxID=3136771 RepID=UPI0013124A67
MNDIEKRARELLAAEMERSGRKGTANKIRQGRPAMFREELRALIAALTPPEGYVLVPVRPTDAMKDAVESIKMPHAYLRTGIRIADFHERYSAMLCARPEVP